MTRLNILLATLQICAWTTAFTNAESKSTTPCSSWSKSGRCEIKLTDSSQEIKQQICGLSPSVKYSVRVAAKNSVSEQKIVTADGEIENLNWSAAHIVTPIDQVPVAPKILSSIPFGQLGIQLNIQKPARDGGQPVTDYILELDTSANFSSPQRLIIVANELHPRPGRSELIYTFKSDFLKPWSSYYLRIQAVNSVGASLKSEASLVTLTSPPRAPQNGILQTPSISSGSITTATVSWASPSPLLEHEEIDGYLVEWWSKRKSPEIQTIRLQYSSPLTTTKFSLGFSISPNVKKVTSMMPWNASASLLRRELINLGWDEESNVGILDNVEVKRSTFSHGYIWSITFGENEHGTNYGDLATLTGEIFASGDIGLPTLTISTEQHGQRPQGRAEIQYLEIRGAGNISGYYRLQFENSDRTPYIPFNASALEIETALEQLWTIRDIVVRKTYDQTDVSAGSLNSFMLRYEITFISNVGNIGGISVASAGLLSSQYNISVVITDGNNSLDKGGFMVTSAVVGETPVDYNTSGILESFITSYEIHGLATGTEYFVAISAMNQKHRFSPRMFPTPLSIVPPVQVPQSPQNVRLDVNKGFSDSLLLYYEPPSSDGGDVILRYRIELDPTKTFDNPIVEDVVCPVKNKRTVWQVETKSNDNGIIDGGSFSLFISGYGFSGRTSEIPFDAVALAQNETGTIEWLNFTFFKVQNGSSSVFTSPSHALQERIFVGNIVRFSGQSQANKNYKVISVLGDTLILSEAFLGYSGPQRLSRHYGGRGSPASSKIYCEYDALLCDEQTVASSGSIQKKVEALSNIVKSGVWVDRDGPSSSNEFIWRITFKDDAPHGTEDFQVTLASNSLSVDRNVGSAKVLVTLLTVGETYSPCEGPKVFPKSGGLVKGLQYFARVSAINSAGYSRPKRAVSPQAPMVVPGPPTSVSLDVVSATELRIMFGSPIDNGGDAIQKYLIEWSLSNSFREVGSTTIEYLKGGSPFFKTIGNLSTGHYYFFRVSAWNSQGYGQPQFSSPPSLNPHKPPSAPTGVEVKVTSETMLTVGWHPPSNNGGDQIRKYRVEWDTRASFESANSPPHKGYIDVDAEENSSHTITMLSPDKVYFIRIFAFNSAGLGDPAVSDPLYVSTSNQVPGIVQGVAIHESSSSSGSLDVKWQRPLIPHHGIPCFGTLDKPRECPSRYGSTLRSSDGGEPILEYQVEYNERSDYRGTDGGRKIVSTTYTTIDQLTSGRNYYIRVLARNTVGSGPYTTGYRIVAP